MYEVLTYSLLANLTFSFGSFYFTIYSKKISVLWMNAFKASVSFLVITLLLILNQHVFTASLVEKTYLLVSGFVGLCIGDLFLLEGMKSLGSSRVIMMFGLSPFFTGIGSYFFFNSVLPLKVIFGVCFMVLCFYLLSLERYKASGHWHLKGILMGLTGVLLDDVGQLLTKETFNENLKLNSLEANFFRASGAIIGFIFIHIIYRKINLKREFFKLKPKDKSLVLIASFFGAFLSLYFYLKSVSLGHLSVVSSMAGTGPLFAEIFESVRTKKAPHPLWWIAFMCFLFALYLFAMT